MIRDFFADVNKFSREDIPRLFVFVGPPGTGKTTLVKLLEEQTNANVVSISASSLVNAWQNSGAAEIKKIYEKAYKDGDSNPQIIFIDEIDAITQADRGRMQDVFRNALLELCQQIANYKNEQEHPHAVVITIVASNELKSLDAALESRAELVEFSLPDDEDREKILRRYAATYPHHFSDTEFENFVQLTEKFSPRDLEEVIKHARFVAKRDAVDSLQIADVLEAIRMVKEKKERTERARREQDEKEYRKRYPYQVDKANAINQWADAVKNTGKAIGSIAVVGSLVYVAAETKEVVKMIKERLNRGDIAALIAVFNWGKLRDNESIKKRIRPDN